MVARYLIRDRVQMFHANRSVAQTFCGAIDRARSSSGQSVTLRLFLFTSAAAGLDHDLSWGERMARLLATQSGEPLLERACDQGYLAGLARGDFSLPLAIAWPCRDRHDSFTVVSVQIAGDCDRRPY